MCPRRQANNSISKYTNAAGGGTVPRGSQIDRATANPSRFVSTEQTLWRQIIRGEPFLNRKLLVYHALCLVTSWGASLGFHQKVLDANELLMRVTMASQSSFSRVG